MTGLPGNLEFFFVFIVKVIETVEFVWSLEAFLDILDDFGSDATPMTPRTVVGTLECLKGGGITVDERRIQRGFASEIDKRPVGNVYQMLTAGGW